MTISRVIFRLEATDLQWFSGEIALGMLIIQHTHRESRLLRISSAQTQLFACQDFLCLASLSAIYADR